MEKKPFNQDIKTEKKTLAIIAPNPAKGKRASLKTYVPISLKMLPVIKEKEK